MEFFSSAVDTLQTIILLGTTLIPLLSGLF